MKTVSLSGSLRENVGKKDARELRKAGRVPCVVYGGKDQIHFSMDERDFSKIVFTRDIYLINLTIGDAVVNTLLQDVAYHPVSDRALHADFLEVDIAGDIVTTLPVRPVGSAIGVLKGGQMKQVIRKLAVKANLNNIPDYIDVDVSDLDIGNSFQVKDLKLENVEILDKPNAVIIAVKVTRIAVEEVEEDDEEGEEGEEGAEGAEGAAPAEGGDKPAPGGKE